ncbi:unnamed protein product [Eretmochelys imbricata]
MSSTLPSSVLLFFCSLEANFAGSLASSVQLDLGRNTVVHCGKVGFFLFFRFFFKKLCILSVKIVLCLTYMIHLLGAEMLPIIYVEENKQHMLPRILQPLRL